MTSHVTSYLFIFHGPIRWQKNSRYYRFKSVCISTDIYGAKSTVGAIDHTHGPTERFAGTFEKRHVPHVAFTVVAVAFGEWTIIYIDLINDSTWESTGEAAEWTYWDTNQPAEGSQDVTAAKWSTGGKWHDISSGNEACYYVCEK